MVLTGISIALGSKLGAEADGSLISTWLIGQRKCEALNLPSRTRSLVWFIFGAILGIVLPKLLTTAFNRSIFPEHRDEVARSTSPDGAVDAVMIRSDCGAPCSANYSVSIVPKGTRPHGLAGEPIFSADDMMDQRIVWKQAHLLEILYSKAFILSFQNVSYPFQTPQNGQNGIYRVEIRLSPSSPDFSYLDKNETY
jgi:hypothetical protein